MSTFLLLIVLLSFLSCSQYSLEQETIEQETIEQEWLNYLCSQVCKGRQSGTSGSYNACKYIVSELEMMGYCPDVNEFTHSDGTILRNISVHIEGACDSLIIIGAHYDGQYMSNTKAHFPAANDNASGVVSLMSLLKDIASYERLYYSLEVCFWDGEETIIHPPFKGSEYYVNSSQDDVKVYINCDTVGYGDNLYIKLSKYSENLMEIVSNMTSISQHLYYHVLFVDKFSSDDFSFYSSKIPTIGITDGSFSFLNPKYPIHTIYDTPNNISVAKLLRVTNLIQSIITELSHSN